MSGEVETKARCVGCGKTKTIVNKAYSLCESCNDRIVKDAHPELWGDKIANNPGAPGGIENNPLNALGDAGIELLNLGEKFGIEKKDVGKMLLKSVLSGKSPLDFLTSEKTERKTKFEKVAKAIKDIAWIPLVYILAYQSMQLLILKLS